MSPVPDAHTDARVLETLRAHDERHIEILQLIRAYAG